MLARTPITILSLFAAALICQSCCVIHDQGSRTTRPDVQLNWQRLAKPPSPAESLLVQLERIDGLDKSPDEQVCRQVDITRSDLIERSAAVLFNTYPGTGGEGRDSLHIPCLVGKLRGTFTIVDEVWLSGTEEYYDEQRFTVSIRRYDPCCFNFLPEQARLYFVLRLDVLPIEARRIRIHFESADVEDVCFTIGNVLNHPRR